MIWREKGRESGPKTGRIHAEWRKGRGRGRSAVLGSGRGSSCSAAGVVQLLQVRQLGVSEWVGGAVREFGRQIASGAISGGARSASVGGSGGGKGGQRIGGFS